MFIGKYYHTLEAKGRVSLPKDLRQNEKEWVVTRGLDGCLFVFTQAAFQTQLQPFSQSPFVHKNNRDFMRLMSGEASQVNVDELGRIGLPDHLIQAAGLKKDVVVVGAMNRIEIWDQTKYHKYLDQIIPQAETLAEKQSEYVTRTGS